MAQYRLDNQEIGQPGNRYEIMMIGTKDGEIVTTYNPFPVTQVGATSTSAFGEPYAIPITPVIQADAVYGLNPRDFETLTSGQGSVAVNTAVITVSSGTTAGSYAVVRTKEYLRYRPGQGALGRFTAAFLTPNTNVTQRAGFTSQEQAIMVGYDGDQFGVVRMNGGKSDIRSLTITANAAGSETFTLTLNGVSFSINVSAGNTVQTAAKIAATNCSGFLLEQINSTVRVAATRNGANTGDYSFTSNGTATGTFSQIQTGVADTAHWTYQANFNVDTLDGSGDVLTNPSGMELTPDKINVYQINYRWLGVGEIRYAIEHSDTGQMVFFHKERYSGKHLTPHLDNPSMRLGYISANKSATTCANTSVVGICVMGAVEGIATTKGFPFGTVSGKKTTLSSGSAHHLMSLRNKLIFDGHFNLKILRLKRISLAYQGNDPVELFILLSPTYSVTPLWDSINSTQSCTAKSTTDATFTLENEVPLTSFVIPINGGQELNVEDLQLQIPANSNIAFAVNSGQSIAAIDMAVTWDEV